MLICCQENGDLSQGLWQIYTDYNRFPFSLSMQYDLIHERGCFFGIFFGRRSESWYDVVCMNMTVHDGRQKYGPAQAGHVQMVCVKTAYTQ